MHRKFLPASDYALGMTLKSGQVFRWQESETGWEGVLAGHWYCLRQTADGIEAIAADATADWSALQSFLQVEVDYVEVIRSFPDDAPMRQAVTACRGLRLLRQDPWECLVSFICSSSKQIVQIMEIIRLLCERFGAPIPVPAGHEPAFAFPTPERLAVASEMELRQCKAGFRAPYLLEAAKAVCSRWVDLQVLHDLPTVEARVVLMSLNGVGRKIADCVLLFAYGRQDAFPVDVWVERALKHFYFPKRSVKPDRLRRFSETHFGPYGGYAQQFLFHYARTVALNRSQAKQAVS